MPTEKIPLVGSLIDRGANPSASSSKDQQFTNCYVEVVSNQITGTSKAFLYKRPGYTAANNAPAGYAGLGGATVWSGLTTPKAVFPYLSGTTLAVYDSALSIVGAALPDGITSWPQITETTDSSGVAMLTLTATRAADTPLVHAWTYTSGAGAWVRINDADFPPNLGTPLQIVGRMVHMDGYAFVMTQDGRIWNSDLNAPTSWTAAGFIKAQASPDGGAGLWRTKNLVVAPGTATIEFFQNTGNATGSPLTRIPSAAIHMGATLVGTGFNPSHLELNDAVYFFGTNNDTAQIGFYKLIGTQVEKISTPAIDKSIQENSSSALYGIAGAFNAHGMTHILLYTGSASMVPCYTLETRQWWYLTTAFAIRSIVSLGSKNYLTYAGRTMGTMDAASPVFTDDGSTYAMTVQTGMIDFGDAKTTFIEDIEVICDTQSTSGNLAVSITTDDYGSFSTARNIDPSTGGRRLTRWGATKRNYNHRFAVKLTESVARPFRGERIDIGYSKGST